MRHSRILLTGTVVAAATALILTPMAATAHTDNLFTWAYNPGDPSTSGFATASKTDAALALLGVDTLSIIDDVTGTEVCDEAGYAVGTVDSGEFSEASVLTFDHSTGAILSGPTTISLGAETAIYGVDELDTFADCTLITLVTYSEGQTGEAIITVDPATGAGTVLVDLPALEAEDEWDYTGLATTKDGVTYIFATIDSFPYVAVVDFDTQTISTPVPLAGLSASFDSSGFTMGVDFDAAGGLWVTTGVNEEEQYHLVSYASGADLAAAEPTDIGILPYQEGLQIESPIPLAADSAAAAPVTPVEPAKPVLAATGSEAPLGVGAAALVLLMAGAAVLLLRRRSA